MSEEPPKSLFVIDDDEGFADSMHHLLEAHGFDVHVFHDAETFIAKRRQTPRPAIALVDVRMPGQSGIDLLTELKDDRLVAVVMMTGHGDIPIAVRAIQRGALEFIEKPFSEERLVQAIDVAVEELDRRLGQWRDERTEAQRLSQLSPREKCVLRHVAEGLNSKQIAVELGLSLRTVEMHRANLLRRLDLRTMAEAIALFLQYGKRGEVEEAS